MNLLYLVTLSNWMIALIVIGAIVLFILLNLVIMLLYTNKIATRLFYNQWRRDDLSKYMRGCSDKDFDYHVDMFNQGMAYRKTILDKVHEVKIIVNEDRLTGEYYDFGFNRTIIIMPGRMETALYGAFYAEPLIKAGYNVLCPDPYAHGLSDGKVISLGSKEGDDVLSWAKYLHDEKGQEDIGLFGICGGSTGALYALKNQHPNYLRFMIADSMFITFFDMYRRHIIDERKPVFPVIYQVLHKIKKYNKVNPYRVTPKKIIKNVREPILFLSGEKDIFSVSKNASKLFKLSRSVHKEIVYLPHGRHSHLRYDDKEIYDQAIEEFLKNLDENNYYYNKLNHIAN